MVLERAVNKIMIVFARRKCRVSQTVLCKVVSEKMCTGSVTELNDYKKLSIIACKGPHLKLLDAARVALNEKKRVQAL
jgi:hypothetical protein